MDEKLEIKQDELTDSELEQIIQEGIVIKEFIISPKLTVSFRNFCEEDRIFLQKYYANVNLNLENPNIDISTFNELRLPFLAAFIYKINNKIFDTPEKKSKLLELLKKAATPLIDKLTTICLDFVKTSPQDILKKN